MLSYQKKISFFLLAVFLLTTISFSNIQASFWDVIKAWVTINPLDVDVSAPAEVEIDKVFKIEAKVINKGKEKIENAKAEIFLPLGIVLLKKNPVQKIGVISDKKEKKTFWSVKGEEIGNYFISILVSGELKEHGISAEDIVMVQVKKPLPRGKPQFNLFQKFINLFQRWLSF